MHRAIEPPKLVMGMAMQAGFRDNEGSLQARRLNAECFVAGGNAEALILVARLLAERASEWGGSVRDLESGLDRHVQIDLPRRYFEILAR